MLQKFVFTAIVLAAVAVAPGWTAANAEGEVREFISRWNAAYTGMDAGALASLETADFELIDRFGHWIKSEGPEFNRRLWAMTFQEIYHGKPGPERVIESVRFLEPRVAVVQAWANHADGVTLEDGTKIPPFREINTYTLIKTDGGWRVQILNIHNQIGPEMERPGEHVPNASAGKPERR